MLSIPCALACSVQSPATLPSTLARRRALAQRLVDRIKTNSDWGMFSAQELKQFAALGDVAFEAIWPVVIARLDAAPAREKDYNLAYTDSVSLYFSMVLLEAAMQPRFTRRVLEETRKREPHWVCRSLLYEVLATPRSDTRLVVPYFRQALHRIPAYQEPDDGERAAQEYLRRFLPRQIAARQRRFLADPKAHYLRRSAAFVDLATAGDPRSVRAVLSSRDRSRTLPPMHFSRDGSLSLDGDGDGITDALEKRLGADPQKADTDSDGLPDGTDRNPLAAPHPLTDEEQVVAAAVEARFVFRPATRPLLVRLPPGVHPLELAGTRALTLVSGHGSTPPWSRDLEGEELSFTPPGKKPGWIVWNASHTETWLQIQVGVSEDSVPMRVKRLDGHWLVTETGLRAALSLTGHDLSAR